MSSHTNRNRRHVFTGAKVVCSVDQESKQETTASRQKQVRKKMGKLSKGMKEVHKPTKPFEFNNSYLQFSKASYEVDESRNAK